MLQNNLQLTLQQLINHRYPDSSVMAKWERSHQPKFGDISTSVALSLAKRFQQSPMDIANQLVSDLLSEETFADLIEKIEVAQPGFINVTLANQGLLSEITTQQQPLLRHPDPPGKGQTIMVEFSSPNIAKPFNVGHLRSTIIGDCLARVHTYLGYTVLKDNHLGDWGTQYGLLAFAVENWSSWDKIEANPIPELFALYVRINQEAKTNQELQEAARGYFKKLEQGDEQARQVWQRLSSISMVDFNRLYQKFDVSFDMMLSEAFYQPYLEEVVEDCINAGVAEPSQGALVINFTDPKIQDPPLMIRKSNGTSTYATRDLAGIKYRFNQFKLDKLIIEIGVEQQFYFQQIIAASLRMGWVKPGQLLHVGHGHFLAASGKRLSTRKGETVWIDELIKELEDKAAQIVTDKSPELSREQRQQISEEVAIGALKYNDLSQNRLSSIVFDKDKALSLEGNSSPYLQYTIARANSVLRQAQYNGAELSAQDLTISEKSLLLSLTQFNQVVEQVSHDYLPNSLTNYLFQTAQKFNSFYQSDPILKANPPVQQRRLAICNATVQVLSSGLQLLGVSVPDRM